MALSSASRHGLGTRCLAPVAVATGAAGAVAAAAVRNPFHPATWPSCPFHAATGLYCPFCGSTRAVFALMHGNLTLMVSNNPLLPLLALVAVWAWLGWLAKTMGVAARILRPASSPLRRFAIPSVVAVFWVARNIPGLAVLAPHGHP